MDLDEFRDWQALAKVEVEERDGEEPEPEKKDIVSDPAKIRAFFAAHH